MEVVDPFTGDVINQVALGSTVALRMRLAVVNGRYTTVMIMYITVQALERKVGGGGGRREERKIGRL